MQYNDNDDVYLDVAKSHHGKCFICGRMRRFNNKLKIINTASLGYAYSHHNRLILKSHARACSMHLDANGNIKQDQYLLRGFKTKSRPFYRETVLMFDSIKYHNENNGIFDHFKDMAFLDDQHCIDITGWSKPIFTDFVSYLTDLKTTDRRTKEELVAIYRYWLRNGLTQTCICLYRKNTSQQSIALYLDITRVSINKYFVPFFLGSNKGRDFFNKHLTGSSKILYSMEKDDDLCFIADGTYLRCKKSRNHKFQYDSFSTHKGAHLLKPMIVCCPDGYIVDIYGAFKARDNDATALKYILDKDVHIRNYVSEGKTRWVLDRGFRDSLKKLRDINNVTVIYTPTITSFKEENEKQRNEIDFKISKKEQAFKEKTKGKKGKKDKFFQINRLTTGQAAESRMASRVRWIIEAVNGTLWKHKALNNVDNNELGHIMIDVRIACAMMNFVHHKETYQKDPDNIHTLKIARLMKKKATEEPQINRLDFFLAEENLNQNLKTVKDTWIQTTFNNISDFPRLKRKQIRRIITLGSYQQKTCIDYTSSMASPENEEVTNIYDLSFEFVIRMKNNELKNGDKFYFNAEDTSFINKLIKRKSKIIKVVVTSRFHRSKPMTHNVYVRYKPIGSSDAETDITKDSEKVILKKKCIVYHIEGYICNCDLGKRITGACVHVTCVLNYLGRVKDNPNHGEILNRGDFLNKIFINMNENQMPNEPEYVRSTRRKKIIEQDSSEDSCEDTSHFEYISEAESEATGEIIELMKKQFQQKVMKCPNQKSIKKNRTENKKKKKLNEDQSEDEFYSTKDTLSEIDLNDISTYEDFNLRGNNGDARDNISIDDVEKFSINKNKAKRTRKNIKNSQDGFLSDNDSFNFGENGFDENSLVESNLFENKDLNKYISQNKKTTFDKKQKINLKFYTEKYNLKKSNILLEKLADDQFNKYMYNIKIFDEKEMINNAPSWSANIIFDKKEVQLVNTCPLDYGLFGLWISSKLNLRFLSTLKETHITRHIVEILNDINKKDWNSAREKWVTKILDKKQIIRKSKFSQIISIYGSTEDIFFNRLNDFQRYTLRQQCSNNCRFNNSDLSDKLIETGIYSVILKKNFHGRLLVKGYTNYADICDECNSEISQQISFDHTPNFLSMCYLFDFEISLSDIINDKKLIIKLNKVTNTITTTSATQYKFLFGIHYDPSGDGHFTAVFYIFNKYYKVDDLGKRNEKVKEINYESDKILFDKRLSSAYYYRMDLKSVSFSKEYESSSASEPPSASVHPSASEPPSSSGPPSAPEPSTASEPPFVFEPSSASEPPFVFEPSLASEPPFVFKPSFASGLSSEPEPSSAYKPPFFSEPSSASEPPFVFKPSFASGPSSATEPSSEPEPSSAYKPPFFSEPSSSLEPSILDRITSRKRILQQPLSDDSDGEEEGIYTTLHKRIFSEINEWQNAMKKELEDKIEKEYEEQIMQLKKKNESFDRKKIKKTISDEIYQKWALEKVLADPELAKQSGFDPQLWIHK